MNKLTANLTLITIILIALLWAVSAVPTTPARPALPATVKQQVVQSQEVRVILVGRPW